MDLKTAAQQAADYFTDFIGLLPVPGRVNELIEALNSSAASHGEPVPWTVEEAISDRNGLIGWQMKLGAQAIQVWRNQAGMPGFRDGSGFLPRIGETISYRSSSAASQGELEAHDFHYSDEVTGWLRDQRDEFEGRETLDVMFALGRTPPISLHGATYSPLYGRPQASERQQGGEADEFETRADGKRVRKDRWEWGIRRIVALMWGNRHKFEVDEVFEAVRAIVPSPFEDGDDEALAHASQEGFGALGDVCPGCTASNAPAPAATRAVEAPTVEVAHEMGANGGPAVESERQAFEAWMRGHCWALSATWTGTQYLGDAEHGGDVDPRAMATRRLWAAWRDRAALAAQPPQAPPAAPSAEQGEALATRIAELEAELDDKDAELDQARQTPWPEWAKKILKLCREYSGYDGYHDADGVDLVEEVRENFAEFAGQIERLKSTQPAAPVGWQQIEDALVDACLEAEIPDSKFQSLAIAMRSALAAPKTGGANG